MRVGVVGAMGAMGVKYDKIVLCHFTYNLLCKGTRLFCCEVTGSLPSDGIAYHDGYFLYRIRNNNVCS